MTMNLVHHVHFHFHASSSSSSIFSNPLIIINQNRSCLGRGFVISFPVNLRRKSKTNSKQIEMTMGVPVPVPARDRVIDFGKYKGKMLGTLPSSYLKWVSNNLRARDFEEWAKLADQVLGDPIYRDRIEWEFAQNVLNGTQLNIKKSLSCSSSSSRPSAVSELIEISERFGWDNQDKVGWSKVDFELLGTSKGPRIPRLETTTSTLNVNVNVAEEAQPKHKDPAAFHVQGGRRMERRERQKMKMMRLRWTREAQEPQTQTQTHTHTHTVWSSGMKEKSRGSFADEFDFELDDDDGNKDDEMEQNGIGNPFPGRQALLRKAINHRRRFVS